MSGDVFGNGMLLSRHIRLVAAFDHRHIFLDPEPRCGDELRRARAPVQAAALVVGRLRREADLDGRRHPSRAAPSRSRSRRRSRQALAHHGRRADADRARQRDPQGAGRPALQRRHRHLRQGRRARRTRRSATAPTTRCASTAASCAARSSPKAATSAARSSGRIEYALAGGRIYTDAIDNSAGVDTSDHEVNIKILLGLPIADGELTEKQRNALLAEMTDDVAALVLRDNYLPDAGAVGHRTHRAAAARRAGALHAVPGEGRAAQPRDRVPAVRRGDRRAARAAATGSPAPERAVLLAYSKIWLYDELLASPLPDDPWVATALVRYFPQRAARDATRRTWRAIR